MLEQERQYTVWGFVWILHETEGRCKLYPSDRICLPVLRQGQTIRFKLFLNFIINQSIHSRLWKFPSFKMTRRAILRPLCDAILVWDIYSRKNRDIEIILENFSVSVCIEILKRKVHSSSSTRGTCLIVRLKLETKLKSWPTKKREFT